MDIFDRAAELGRLIASSEEMTEYKNCEAKIEQDEKAKTLLNDYKLLQIEMVQAAQGNREKQVLDGIRERLLLKQDEINVYDTTRSYLDAKAGFDKFMKRINDVLIFAISGEESCTPDKCSSCSGGCGK